MNNLNLILEKIAAESQEKIDAVNEERDRKISEIDRAAEDKISAILSRAESAALKEYETEVARAESAGKLAEREIILSAKAALVEQVFSAAADRIRSLPDKEYVATLARLLAGAVIERQSAVEALIEKYGEEEYGADAGLPYDAAFSPEDTEKFGREVISKAEQLIANRDLLVPRIRLSKTPADIDGGVIVKYGESETNCSVEAMIASAKEKVDTTVAAILFP
ncbi:MAG: hypothetical protein IKG80_00985 [Clostridia bacterium]|nr:hypothetical protein [Clostridia bacterium]